MPKLHPWIKSNQFGWWRDGKGGWRSCGHGADFIGFECSGHSPELCLLIWTWLECLGWCAQSSGQHPYLLTQGGLLWSKTRNQTLPGEAEEIAAFWRGTGVVFNLSREMKTPLVDWGALPWLPLLCDLGDSPGDRMKTLGLTFEMCLLSSR